MTMLFMLTHLTRRNQNTNLLDTLAMVQQIRLTWFYIRLIIVIVSLVFTLQFDTLVITIDFILPYNPG